jgi:hypothetical protein
MAYELKPEDVALVIRPIMEEDGSWDGNISTSVALDPTSPLSDEQMNTLLDVVTVMSAFLDWSRYNPTVAEAVRDHRDRLMDAMDDEEDDQLEIDFEGEDSDNVVSLTKWSKTLGNA